jgi:hypothetical protein
MEWLSGNLFFVVVLLVCIGMHLFGHGHRHGNRASKRAEDQHKDHGTSRRKI